MSFCGSRDHWQVANLKFSLLTGVLTPHQLFLKQTNTKQSPLSPAFWVHSSRVDLEDPLKFAGRCHLVDNPATYSFNKKPSRAFQKSIEQLLSQTWLQVGITWGRLSAILRDSDIIGLGCSVGIQSFKRFPSLQGAAKEETTGYRLS